METMHLKVGMALLVKKISSVAWRQKIRSWNNSFYRDMASIWI